MQFRDAESYQNQRGPSNVDAQTMIEKIRFDITEANRNYRGLRQRESRISESDESSVINILLYVILYNMTHSLIFNVAIFLFRHDIQTETDKITRTASILRNQLPAAINRHREKFLQDRLNKETMTLSKELQSLTTQYQKVRTVPKTTQIHIFLPL